MHCPWSGAAALEGPVDHTANDNKSDQLPETETTTPPEIIIIRQLVRMTIGAILFYNNYSENWIPRKFPTLWYIELAKILHIMDNNC
jgi:hypothetical protein